MKKRILSLVLALVMLASMMSVAFADVVTGITADQPTYYASGALKSLRINFTWSAGDVYGGGDGACLVLMTKELAASSTINPWHGDYTDAGELRNLYGNLAEAEADTDLGIIAATALSDVHWDSDYAWTFNFAETDIPLNVNKTYYINIWTQNGTYHFYPDALGAVIRVQDGQVQFVAADDNTYDPNGFNFIPITEKFDITVTAGANMTKAASSGELTQTDLDSSMTDVVFTANDGYYFPEDYMSTATYAGVEVERVDETTVKVKGQPLADIEVTLADASAVPAPPVVPNPPAADYQFDYAYDCQRSPAYPNKNGEVELWSFHEPYTEKEGSGTSASAGDWTLTYLCTWAEFDSNLADYDEVSSAAASVASKYEIEKDDVKIYELKNGGTHVAYGPMVAYGLLEDSRAAANDVKDCALFIADTRSSGNTGFFLTDESMDGVSRFNFIAENTPNDNIVDPNAPQQPEQTTPDTPTVTPDTPTVTPPTSRPNYDTSEEVVWQSGAKEESKANPATSDGFNTAVSAVMALSVLAGAAVVLGKKK